MGRYAEPFERHEQCFDAVGEHNGAGGIGKEGRKGDEEHQTQGHDEAVLYPFLTDMNEFPGKELIARCGKHMDTHGEYQNNPQRLDGFPNQGHRHAGQGDGQESKARHQDVGPQVIGQENGHNENHGAENLGSGVHAVQERISRVILAEGNIC